MPNALDMYRAQQTAANEVHAKLSEVSALVQQVRRDVDALAKSNDLRDLIRQEQSWLEQAERTVREVQRCPALARSRGLPLLARSDLPMGVRACIRLLSVWASNAGHAWMNRDHEQDIAILRSRVELLDSIERRVGALTTAERRTVDRLLGWPTLTTVPDETAR
jgi:hypothetical protein